MDFRVWLERRFLEPNQLAKDGIEKFLSTLSQNVIRLKPQRPDYIGSISIGNRKIKVYAVDSVYRAGYVRNSDSIYIQYSLLNKPDVVRTLLQHEITHAIDKSPNLMGSQYQKDAGKLNKDYFNNPSEFNAYGANIAQHIRDEIAKMSPAKKQNEILKLKDWLRNGSPNGLKWLLSRMGISTMPSTLSLPWKKIDLVFAQNAWHTDPQLWRQFKQKLFNLIQQLEAQPQSIGLSNRLPMASKNLNPVGAAG